MDFKRYFGSKQKEQSGTVSTVERVKLTLEEKLFINSTIFEEGLYENQEDLLNYLTEDIETISGHSRSKATIKYYIYDSKERRENLPRPYQMVYNTSGYTDQFKKRVLQEIREHGRVEVTKRFAIPSGTISGWMDANSVYQRPSNPTGAGLSNEGYTEIEANNSLLTPIKRLGNVMKKKGKKSISEIERLGIHQSVTLIGEKATAQKYGYSTQAVRNTFIAVETLLNKTTSTATNNVTAPKPKKKEPTSNKTSTTKDIDYLELITDCKFLVDYYTELAEMAEKAEQIDRDKETADTYADRIRLQVDQLKKNLSL